MTDRMNALTVVLSTDMREEQVVGLADAIRMMRGVLSVTSNVTDLHFHIAEQRAIRELGDKLWQVLYPRNGIDAAQEKPGG